MLYCRAGFEGECAQEISALASARGVYGHVRAKRDDAYVEFAADGARDVRLDSSLPELIFARLPSLACLMLTWFLCRSCLQRAVRGRTPSGVRWSLAGAFLIERFFESLAAARLV